MLFLGSEWGEPRNLGTLKSLGLVVGVVGDLGDYGSLESFKRTWNLSIIMKYSEQFILVILLYPDFEVDDLMCPLKVGRCAQPEFMKI